VESRRLPQQAHHCLQTFDKAAAATTGGAAAAASLTARLADMRLL
jgi:hypothetical protein